MHRWAMVRIVNGELVDDSAPAPASGPLAFSSLAAGATRYRRIIPPAQAVCPLSSVPLQLGPATCGRDGVEMLLPYARRARLRAREQGAAQVVRAGQAPRRCA